MARKHLILRAYYREWSLMDKDIPYESNKPHDQNIRFRLFREVIDRVSVNSPSIVIAGDLNLDKWLPNDPYTRPDIQETLPLLDELIEDKNLTIMNTKCTRFMTNERPSMLDIQFNIHIHRPE